MLRFPALGALDIPKLLPKGYIPSVHEYRNNYWPTNQFFIQLRAARLYHGSETDKSSSA
jgi:hypothetical protein